MSGTTEARLPECATESFSDRDGAGNKPFRRACNREHIAGICLSLHGVPFVGLFFDRHIASKHDDVASPYVDLDALHAQSGLDRPFGSLGDITLFDRVSASGHRISPPPVVAPASIM